jgi:broad specificity phosphatase PhoE
MAAKVILIRHGETGQQYRERFIGSTDLPLSSEGRLQSTLLARPLRREAVAKYLSSPASRAGETALAAFNGETFSPEIEPDIREIDFGAWEGKTFEEIHASDPDAVARWAAYQEDFAFPGGETIAAFVSRVEKAGRKIAADPAESVAVFTHAGVIRTLICHYLALDHRNYLNFDVKPASITTIAICNGRGVLTGLNDLCHLEDGHGG